MFLDQRTWFFLLVFRIVSLFFAITTAFHYSMFLFFSQLFTPSFILSFVFLRPNAIVHQTSDAASFRFFCDCFYIYERHNLIQSLIPATLRHVNSVRNQVRFFYSQMVCLYKLTVCTTYMLHFNFCWSFGQKI